MCRRLKVDSYIAHCTKIKLQWIKDLDIQTETLKLQEDKIEETVNTTAQAKTAPEQSRDGVISKYKASAQQKKNNQQSEKTT